jgi:hypothetical protein
LSFYFTIHVYKLKALNRLFITGYLLLLTNFV